MAASNHLCRCMTLLLYLVLVMTPVIYGLSIHLLVTQPPTSLPTKPLPNTREHLFSSLLSSRQVKLSALVLPTYLPTVNGALNMRLQSLFFFPVLLSFVAFSCIPSPTAQPNLAARKTKP